MKRAVFLGSVVALAALCPRAHATPTARLVYVRAPEAESCPTEEAMRAAVVARLGYDPFRVSATATLLAELDRQRGAFVARVKLVDENNNVRGQREHVRRGDCADIIDAAALTISIAIDPESAMRAPGMPPPVEASAEPAAEPTPAPASALALPPPEGDPSPNPRVGGPVKRFSIRVEAAGWVGAAASFAWGAQIGAEVASGRWSLALEGRADLPASRNLGRGTVSTTYVGAATVPCVDFWRLRGCAVASAGVLAARMEGISSPEDDATVRLAFGPRISFLLPLTSDIAVIVSETALLGAREEKLTVQQSESWSISRVSLGTTLGVTSRLF